MGTNGRGRNGASSEIGCPLFFAHSPFCYVCTSTWISTFEKSPNGKKQMGYEQALMPCTERRYTIGTKWNGLWTGLVQSGGGYKWGLHTCVLASISALTHTLSFPPKHHIRIPPPGSLSLAASVSVSLCVSLFLCVCVSLSVCLSISLSLSLSLLGTGKSSFPWKLQRVWRWKAWHNTAHRTTRSKWMYRGSKWTYSDIALCLASLRCSPSGTC